VGGIYVLLFVAGRDLLGLEDGFLGLDGEGRSAGAPKALRRSALNSKIIYSLDGELNPNVLVWERAILLLDISSEACV